jgi:hypothetical protein
MIKNKHNQLLSLDSPTNLKKTLNHIFFGYLESTEADNHEKRNEALVLYATIAKIIEE